MRSSSGIIGVSTKTASTGVSTSSPPVETLVTVFVEVYVAVETVLAVVETVCIALVAELAFAFPPTDPEFIYTFNVLAWSLVIAEHVIDSSYTTLYPASQPVNFAFTVI